MVGHGMRSFLIGSDWKWNIFDSFLVLLSLPDLISFNQEGGGTGSLSVFRTFRIFRFFRILRLLRVMRFFHSFRVMVYSILGSMLNLLWVFLLLLFVMYFFAVVFVTAAADYFELHAQNPQLANTTSV